MHTRLVLADFEMLCADVADQAEESLKPKGAISRAAGCKLLEAGLNNMSCALVRGTNKSGSVSRGLPQGILLHNADVTHGH